MFIIEQERFGRVQLVRDYILASRLRNLDGDKPLSAQVSTLIGLLWKQHLTSKSWQPRKNHFFKKAAFGSATITPFIRVPFFSYGIVQLSLRRGSIDRVTICVSSRYMPPYLKSGSRLLRQKELKTETWSIAGTKPQLNKNLGVIYESVVRLSKKKKIFSVFSLDQLRKANG